MKNMKHSLLNALARLAVVCLMLSFGLKLVAGPATSGDLLRQAYVTLSQADHDYKGHEKQGVSDAQLRSAQGLLEQARPGLPEKAQKQVDKALDELSTALKIK
jgi:hypothetical protein